MDQELVYAAAYELGRRCVCTHQMAALFFLHEMTLWPYDSGKWYIFILEEHSC